SSSSAPCSSSASSRRTVGSPSQKRSPWISCSPSMCRTAIFSTAGVPSARRADATHAPSPWRSPNGPSRANDQRRDNTSAIAGTGPDEAARLVTGLPILVALCYLLTTVTASQGPDGFPIGADDPLRQAQESLSEFLTVERTLDAQHARADDRRWKKLKK